MLVENDCMRLTGGDAEAVEAETLKFYRFQFHLGFKLSIFRSILRTIRPVLNLFLSKIDFCWRWEISCSG